MPAPVIAAGILSRLAGLASWTGGVAGPTAALAPLRFILQGANSLFPNTLPSPTDVMLAMRAGLMEYKSAEILMLLNGVAFPKSPGGDPNAPWKWVKPLARSWERVFRSTFSYPSPLQSEELYNRGVITALTFNDILRRHGFFEPETRNMLIELSTHLPPVSDLVRFVIREVFNDELRKELGYEDEYDNNPDFKHWMNALGYRNTYIVGTDGEPKKLDIPLAYWVAHWVLPSPTQLYQMLWRIRPSRLPRYQAMGLDPEVVDIDTVKTVLKAHDYPLKWRERLAAISFKPLGRRDLLRAIKYQVITDKTEIKEYFLDEGFIEEDAVRMTEVYQKIGEEARFEGPMRVARSNVKKAYCLGIINSEKAKDLMREHGLDDAQALIAVNNIDTECRITNVDNTIKAIKRMVMSGLITLQGGRDKLTNLGLEANRITELTDLWQVILDSGQKQLAASKIQDMIVRGLMQPSEANDRLRNLGYLQDSTDYLIAAATQDFAKRVEDGLLKAAREAEKQREKLRQELARHGSPQQLAKWYREGLIGETEARQRLDQLGWPRADQDRLVAGG